MLEKIFSNSPFFEIGNGLSLYNEGNNFADYSLYVSFVKGIAPIDKVSKENLDVSGLATGRVGYDNTEAGINEALIESDGALFYGAYAAEPVESETVAEWSGTGPWTYTLTLSELGTYTLSTDVPGATVVVTAGTASIT